MVPGSALAEELAASTGTRPATATPSAASSHHLILPISFLLSGNSFSTSRAEITAPESRPSTVRTWITYEANARFNPPGHGSRVLPAPARVRGAAGVGPGPGEVARPDHENGRRGPHRLGSEPLEIVRFPEVRPGS